MTLAPPSPGVPHRARWRRARDRRATPAGRARGGRGDLARRAARPGASRHRPRVPSSSAWRSRGCTSLPRSSAPRRPPDGSRRGTRTSWRAHVPTRPAVQPRSPSCASRTGSAVRSPTCAPSGRPCRSRSSPRSSSSRTSSCRCSGPPAPTWCCCSPSSTRRSGSRGSSSGRWRSGSSRSWRRTTRRSCAPRSPRTRG